MSPHPKYVAPLWVYKMNDDRSSFRRELDKIRLKREFTHHIQFERPGWPQHATIDLNTVTQHAYEQDLQGLWSVVFDGDIVHFYCNRDDDALKMKLILA